VGRLGRETKGRVAGSHRLALLHGELEELVPKSCAFSTKKQDRFGTREVLQIGMIYENPSLDWRQLKNSVGSPRPTCTDSYAAKSLPKSYSLPRLDGVLWLMWSILCRSPYHHERGRPILGTLRFFQVATYPKFLGGH
jgi:hypothetical protein